MAQWIIAGSVANPVDAVAGLSKGAGLAGQDVREWVWRASPSVGDKDSVA